MKGGVRPSVAVGLVLCAMVGGQWAFEHFVAQPMERSIAQAQVALESARAAPPRAAASTSQERLDAIAAHLRAQPGWRNRIAQWHLAAQRNAVLIRKAEYRSPEAVGPVGKCEVRADLAGEYPAIRQFLQDVLRQDEAAALESLAMHRCATTVCAVAQFVFYCQ
ncbi:hypothetical protein [Candidatus Symbiobacter mobilis]|uniref:Uncharacterized protein n=1 Tax=Candidatus Symbiobacter mobilis CR TaxID=946483 RepID=U5NAI1_9BURK|nr:hypothetical protein [Candidatus Symbiobacter mobilis]AGX87204.1 hypothetical protein Cenrod_1111 [Candidatus Symbiobacter mobilis CR]